MNKRILFTLLLSLIFGVLCVAEDGGKLWLRYNQNKQAEVSKTDNAMGATVDISVAELQNNWLGQPIKLELNSNLTQLREGFKIISSNTQVTISAYKEIGLLYGAYHLLRLQQTNSATNNLNIEEIPFYNYRMLNHWDNLDGTIERGYAGRSIWKWNELPNIKSDRYKFYARANASIGVNASVLNNVNASANILTTEYLNKIKVLADEFRPYGIKIYVSLNFAAPKTIGGLTTADPLNTEVITWWQNKINEIYSIIPDFGGFLVKANSEGQPGPQDYGRTHADGANMLAKALKNHDGIVIWRAFVYGNTTAERAAQAYLEFKPLDGNFDDNVILQIKNGPMDFQPREPFSALFGAMDNTKLGIEFQITQEYLGASNQLVYLAPMWKECLDSDTYKNGAGNTVKQRITTSSLIAGVANIGDNANWCGHDFAQANWYAFGRLAWNPNLSSEEIAKEWIAQTFTNNQNFVNPVSKIMLDSWETAVNYMTPMGLSFIASTGHHYGPLPWSRGDFHKANAQTIGTFREVAASQYNPALATQFGNTASCPEKYILWFHAVSWDRTMSNGKTLWDNLCIKYEEGVTQTAGFKNTWKTLNNLIDSERFNSIASKLDLQAEEAIWWKDACLLYFQSLNQKSLPQGVSVPQYDLSFLKTVSFSNYSSFGCPTAKEIYDNVINKKKELVANEDYSYLIVNNSFELASDVADCTKNIDVAAGINVWVDGAWRASESACKQFYGWTTNQPAFNFGNNAQGIDAVATEKNGNWALWISGNCVLPDFYEFYQIIDKNDLPAGTYKLQCGMAVQHTKMTNQRLFANNRVQYHGNSSQYVSNLTPGENNTFAGHSSGDKTLKEMAVYVTIAENDSLKIGIRTSNKLSNGSVAPLDNPMRGWFRADNFRLTKLDPASKEFKEVTNANLAALTVDFGVLEPAFNPEVTTYTCRIPQGISRVNPKGTTSSNLAMVNFPVVDIISGTGTANIIVTASDEITTKTYTINFVADNDQNLTNLIVNNDFELAPDASCIPVSITSGMDGWVSNAWRPKESSCATKQFYGWTHNQAILGTSNSQGINTDGDRKNGNWAMWMGGNGGSATEETEIELYQTIDKSALSAGTYLVQCLLAVGSTKKFNQRLFANNNVQYLGSPQDYTSNLVDNGTENYTFARHLDFGETSLRELKVYVSIGENDSLKLGIRTSNRQADGTLKVQQSPMFRADYFRLTKIESGKAADATLKNIVLSTGNLNFSPTTYSYNVVLPDTAKVISISVLPQVPDVRILGDEDVNVASGTGVSNISVTALDGNSNKTYTINYFLNTELKVPELIKTINYTIINKNLIVKEIKSFCLYSLSGIKVADVDKNTTHTTITLMPGIYFLKAKGFKTTKIIVS
ncbi:MAG: hypothetical protein PHP99_00445 [Paludibacter sp.]|nr:hypothetical protein [Paludibacter sp.]